MHLTVNDILKLPLLTETNIIAGKEGLNNVIENVSFIEAPDSINWIMKHDFLITNSYLINLNKGLQNNIINKLVQNNAAAIGIKLNRYLENVPEEMIKQANLMSFPILILPYKITPSQIITSITSEILREKTLSEIQYHFRNNFFYEILFSNNISKDILLKKASFVGWDINKKYGLLVINIDNCNIIENLITTISSIKAKNDFYVFKYDQDVIIFFEIRNPQQSKSQLLNFAHEIKKLTNKKLPKLKISIGIGRYYDSLFNLHKSYYEAKKTLALASTIFNQDAIIHFDDLGIYRILCKYENQDELKDFYQETVGKVIEYDRKNNTEYYKTIESFIKNNGCINKTAKELFVHYNTIRYRINKISTIINMDLTESEKRLNFQIGMKIAHLFDWECK